MKKHILGFVIFSLIVGTAVLVSAMFYKKVVTPKFEYRYEVSKRSCWRDGKRLSESRPVELKIVQAVFNSNTRQLDVTFNGSEIKNVDLNIQFMRASVKTGTKTGSVYTENVTITPDYNNHAVASINLPSRSTVYLEPSDTMYINISGADNDSAMVNFPVLIVKNK